MKKSFSLLATSLLFLSLCGAANASLFSEFDENIGLEDGDWKIVGDISGWNKVRNKDGIKVHKDSGNQYVELDSTKNSAMYRDEYLPSGEYVLEWMYSAQTNNNGHDNGIQFTLFDAGDKLYFNRISKSKEEEEQTPDWEQVNWTFSILEDAMYTLEFAAFGKNNGLGGFIDSVSLSSFTDDSEPELTRTPIPESATMLLFGLGLVGISGATRHRMRKQ